MQTATRQTGNASGIPMGRPRSTKSINPTVSRMIAGEWEVPDELFEQLNREFKFTLDACARDYNAKCSKYYTLQNSGLDKSWKGETVWCFPPSGTSAFRVWVKKASEEAKRKGTTVVMLLPVSTDSDWFQRYINKKDGVRIRFLSGRIKFRNRALPSWSDAREETTGGKRPSMLVIFDGSKRKFCVE